MGRPSAVQRNRFGLAGGPAAPVAPATMRPIGPCFAGSDLLHAAGRFRPAPFVTCGRGGIGRRAALRSLWGNPWKFESSRPHQEISPHQRTIGPRGGCDNLRTSVQTPKSTIRSRFPAPGNRACWRRPPGRRHMAALSGSAIEQNPPIRGRSRGSCSRCRSPGCSWPRKAQTPSPRQGGICTARHQG